MPVPSHGTFPTCKGSNPCATSLRSMFRLGRSTLNINMKAFRQCSCGSTETLEHLLLHCNLTLHHRHLLLLTLKITLLNEKIYNQPQYSTITNKTLIYILLFGHPKLSFKPTVVIFPALSRFLKNSRRFKSLVWQCLAIPLSCASCYITCPSVSWLVPVLFVCCHFLCSFVYSVHFVFSIPPVYIVPTNSIRQEASIRPRPAANSL